ncbi:RCBTB2, partial [Acrasis kona]
MTNQGSLYTWGVGINGQLGDGLRTSSSVPVAVSTAGVLNNKAILQYSLGTDHSIVLTTDNTLIAWGSNALYQTGVSFTSSLQVPLPALVNTTGVMEGETIVQVTTGSYFTIALDSNGLLYAWGSNQYGFLGINSTQSTKEIVSVLSSGNSALNGKVVVKIASGTQTVFALTSDNQLVAWGYNSNGQTGTGLSPSSIQSPRFVVSTAYAGKTISNIIAGDAITFIMMTDGTVYGWGNNGGKIPIDVSELGSLMDILTPRLMNPNGKFSSYVFNKMSTGTATIAFISANNTNVATAAAGTSTPTLAPTPTATPAPTPTPTFTDTPTPTPTSTATPTPAPTLTPTPTDSSTFIPTSTSTPTPTLTSTPTP